MAGQFAFAQLTLSPSPPAGLVRLSPDSAYLGGECQTSDKASIPRNAVIAIEDLCFPAKWLARPDRHADCSTSMIGVLGVRFRGSPELVLVEQMGLSNAHFHLQMFGFLENAHGDRKEVESIEQIQWCARTQLTSEGVRLPARTCREPRQFAVSFDYGTPLNNKILTNGFSFYLRLAGTPAPGFDVDSAAAEVLSSFGRALTFWTSALKENDALLTPAIRAFLQSRVLTSSGGFILLTPPQVIRLSCPHTATFVVELNFGSNEVFAVHPSFRELARARLEGRTIALNLRDVKCFKTMPQVQEKQLVLKDDRCVNLLPVLMHELGHAFGIDHIESSSGWALMNPVISSRSTVPSQADVKALTTALEKSVTGARPGELEFRESASLLAPEEWWTNIK